ncbi:Clavaminate synthase-like protein [Aureobasidium sp. EXF-10727]|nr:Clavaminate synthase-like protein [Aureobasidium sp. EXF-10727]
MVNSLSSFSSMFCPLQMGVVARSLISSSASELETKASIYLAQASLSDLPSSLRKDLPTPELVMKAGKGDIYDTSIWLGRAPTYTPLHRDPNPNLFVQLAGKKQVRLFKPDLGNAIFHHVQTSIGGAANATMRGAEMMEGAERTALEQAVWNPASDAFWASQGLQCEVGPGDALFIPKGWWHSIKGVGQGMIGSVNWWFR